MINRKFNSNYWYNSKFNQKECMELVKQLLKYKVTPHAIDYIFRSNIRLYPSTCHKELKLMGKYLKTEDTAVFILEKSAKQMDFIESIIPDGTMVKRNATINVEEQTGKLPPFKVYDIFDYWLHNIMLFKKLCYVVVVTDYDYGKDYIDYEIEGLPFRIFFRIFNKEKIYQLLNTLKKKDYSKEELTNTDYIRMIFCIIFSKKEFAKEVIEEIAYLYASMEKINLNHQIDLHNALTMMIKYRFDDEKKQQELIEMITKSAYESTYNDLDVYEAKLVTEEELRDELVQAKVINMHLNDELYQKDEALIQKDDTISQQGKQISQQGKQISQQGKQLIQKDKQIKILKELLQKHNIAY